jgi:catecholate siderophore receptor
LARENTNTYTYAGTPAKPSTIFGDPGADAALVDTRVLTPATQFTSTTLGAYVQDTVQIAPQWKLIGGLRYDHFAGDYERVAGPLERTDRMWSHRVGVLWQPTGQATYYVSEGTSFNPSGDLYQFDPRSANTPPEKSRNLEAGAKWELADGNLSLRTAVFRTQKYNERNTDLVDASPTNYLLNGKRHTDGIEFEAAGKPAQDVEVFGGLTYMRGKIDAAGSSPGSQASVGKDSGLTPRWTGNVWLTWQVLPKWRLGIGADGMSDRLPAQAEAGVNKAPGYVKADALVEYATGPYKLRLNVFNLFDKVYADGVYRGFTVPGTTRAAQVTATATF